MNNPHFQHVYKSTVTSFQDSITQHMPECAYRDYCLWALSPLNADSELWLHLMGIPQFVQLTLTLLSNFANGRGPDHLTEASIPMNVYLIYEVVSDDLAIGLANQIPKDMTYSQRRSLLLAFNEAMISRLKGHPKTTVDLLEPLQSASKVISGFEQSLIPDRHRNLAQTYLDQRPDLSLSELEYAVWPRLVVNIETCATLANTVSDYQVGPITTAGLINRYSAVTMLLEEPQMPLPKRVCVSADAILVVPTLAYYIGMFVEKRLPAETFRSIIADGTLSEALYNAAILVRLLNDVGTPLLTQSDFRHDLLQHLRIYAVANSTDPLTLSEALLDSLSHFGPALTRLNKDISHGEFNLCLYGISHMPVSSALPIFEHRLDYLSGLYTHCQTLLAAGLETIAKRLNDESASRLIDKFVRFHIMLYENDYTGATGEYTVGT